jgi:hypothetical protein
MTPEEIENRITLMIQLLDSLYHQNKRLQETVECVLHTICKNDDDKTTNSIGKFLCSEFRNRTNSP